MSGFKELKVVDVEWLTLVANEKEVINDADQDEALSQGFFNQEEGDKFDPDIAAVLPATIQHLSLYNIPYQQISSIIRLLYEKGQGEAALDLTSIDLALSLFEEPGSDWGAIEEAAQSAGVVLKGRLD